MEKVKMCNLSFDGINIVSYPYEWYLKLLNDYCYFTDVGKYYIYTEDVEVEKDVS